MDVRSVVILVVATAVVVAATTWLLGASLRSRRERRMSRVVRDAVVELAAAGSHEAVAAAARRAVTHLVPPHPQPGVGVADPVAGGGAVGQGRLVPVDAARSGGGAQPGALLVDPATASRWWLRPALEAVSADAALALARLRPVDPLAPPTGERYLGELVEETTDVVLVIDSDDRIRYASPSARTVFGTPVLDGTPLPDLVDDSQRRTAEVLLRHARGGKAGAAPGRGRADWTVHARDGRMVQVEASCRPLQAGDSVSGVVVTLRDVTTQRHLEHELTRRMFHDPLTGLPNRRLFRERVDHAVADGRDPSGVLLIDLDDFKAINDTLGHDAGDAVLTAIGRRLGDAVGRDGLAARLGDDEFAALVRGVTPEGSTGAAARIADALTEPVPLASSAVSCSASIGVATSEGANSALELLQHADLALAAAKAAGHGQRRQYHPSMTHAFAERVALRADLARAVQDGTLAVDYQPIVALDTGHTVGLEALLRWRHPTRGLLAPDQFIDVAEDSGLIRPIGEWVLAAAMDAARRWKVSGSHDPPYVSVNVSAQQFRARGFVDTVQRLLAGTGLPPDRLVLEMTESLLMRDDDQAWHELRRLRLSGIRVAIDDFGTGYSALSYLRQVPLDILKLDRLFTSQLASSTRQRELAAGIVRLARSLGLDVVAEGVETEQQRDIAAAIGCAYAQGFLFLRPVSDPQTYLAGHG